MLKVWDTPWPSLAGWRALRFGEIVDMRLVVFDVLLGDFDVDEDDCVMLLS